MKTGLFAVIASCFFLACGSANASGPHRLVKVDNWNGGAYTNDATGAFSHCAASARYQSGITFYVSVNRNYDWTIAFSRPSWELTPGRPISLDLYFDGAGPVRVSGTVDKPDFFIVPMPSNSALIRAFRNAQKMDAIVLGNRFQFRLDATARLLPALAACVQQYERPQTATGTATSPNTTAKLSAEAEQERTKLINEAAQQHIQCMHDRMREIVPYSSENAETLAQVIITRCEEAEKKFISLGVALYGATRREVENIVSDRLNRQKRQMVADIVTFRAELTKSLLSQPKSEPSAPPKKEQGI